MNQKEALLTPSLGESNLYRPIWHLSPSKGWMNDPNGFHYANGEFVLYYQHHDALEGDTLIDWARTTSKDLITFHDEGASLLPSTREEGVGISPLWGGCWSGSSFYEKGEEVLCYTATSKEGEVLAFARRKDGHFFLERNIPFVYPPVHIPKEYFRDPYCFSYQEKNYCLVGASKNGDGVILLYEREGTTLCYIGEFFHYSSAIMLECPSVFFLDNHAYLVFSPIFKKEEKEWGPHPSFGIKGKIEDGHFIPLGEVFSWDKGYDFYAALPCQKGKEVYLMGWASLWDKDLDKIPSKKEGFIGVMGLPRYLKENEGTLYQEINPSFYQYLKKEGVFRGDFLKFSHQKACVFTLSLTDTFTGKLFASEGEYFSLSYEKDKGLFKIDAHENHFEKNGVNLTYSGSRQTRVKEGEKITIVIDHSLVEIIFGEGREWMTSLFYPSCDNYLHLFEGKNLSIEVYSSKKE